MFAVMALLFSYGTLRQESVQLSMFGRRFAGSSDELVGFEQSTVAIADPEVRARLGTTHHQNVVRGDARAAGTVYEIADEELAILDAYELVFGYSRMLARLASGRDAWVYVHASL